MDPQRRGGMRPGARDRRGRGMRGPLAPARVPLSLTRAQRFDDVVLDAVERVQRHLPDLAGVEIGVEEVPPPDTVGDATGGSPVPLGRAEPATPRHRARLVVYRRPIELRTRDSLALADLVRDVVAEQVADLLGLTPEQVDPDYEDPGEA